MPVPVQAFSPPRSRWRTVLAWCWWERCTSQCTATAWRCWPRWWRWPVQWRETWCSCCACSLSLHLVRQIQRQYRERDEDRQPDDVGDDERNHAVEDRGEVDILHHGL